MSGPWERYQTAAPPAEPAEAGPWQKFAEPSTPKPRPTSLDESVSRSIVSGILFGFDDELAAGLKTGFGFAGDYGKQVAEERAAKERRHAAHPVASTIAEIGGAIATAPLTGAANLVRVPATAGRLVKGIGAAANAGIAGAGYGAVSGAGNADSNDPAKVAGGAGSGALAGGLFGLAMVPAGAGIALATRPVARAVRSIFSPDAEAARRVGSGIARDTGSATPVSALNASAAELDAARRSGTPMILADTGGEVTRGVLRSAANTSPEARAAIKDAVDPRYAEQADRATDFLRKSTGARGDTGGVLDNIRDAARRANQPAYDRAFSDPRGHAVWSPEIETLTISPFVRDAIKDSTKRAANDAAATGQRPFVNPYAEAGDGTLKLKTNRDGSQTLPNLQFWDAVKRNLDESYNKARATGATEDMRDIERVRARLVGILDEAVPTYPLARRTAAAFFGVEDAIEAGGIIARDMTVANPDIARQVAKMKPAELRAFQEGYANEITRRLNTLTDSRNIAASNVFASPAMRERTAIVFGPQKASEIEAFIGLESTMNKAREALNNSTTTRQLVELGLASGAAGAVFSGGDLTNPSMYLPALLTFGGRRIGRVVDTKVSQRVGELLATGDPDKVKAAAKLAAGTPGFLDALRSANDVLARIMAPNAGRSGAAPAVTALPGHAEERDQK